MSTRSAPSTLSALVLVTQPVTASTWPVISGVMSAPIGTIVTAFSSILFLASSALSRMMPVDWMPTFLPTMSWALLDRLFLEREEAVRVLLHADREALDRQALRHRQHQRRARRHLAEVEATRRDDGDAVDVGAAGLDLEVDPFLLEVALLLGDDLADLVAADQPAELHVDLGLAGRACADRQQAAGAQQAAGRRGRQQPATISIQDVRHHHLPAACVRTILWNPGRSRKDRFAPP